MRNGAAVFTALFGMLVIRNSFLFRTPIHELGDTGANSILTAQAKSLELLVGNYSRQGFSHPGPGYIYVQAFGEWLLHDLLGIVPTPWNGQIIALYLLNAALLTTVTLIIGSWARSWLVAGTSLLAMLALISLRPNILNDSWMPYVYVPSFLLLLVAGASVAAGRSQHLWALALAAGLLIHGHAVFLLFAVVVAVLSAVLLVRRAGFDKKAWGIAVGILAVFLTPILLNTVLHWPGEFGKYIAYGTSDGAGGHTLIEAIEYVYWYWWPFQDLLPAWLGVPIMAAVICAAWRVKHPFVRAGLGLSGVVTVLLLYYAYAGIDDLSHPYMGYFYWAVPLFLIAALAFGLSLQWPAHIEVAWVAPLAVALTVMAVVPGFRSNANDNNPSVPATLAALRQHADGRPLVVELAGNNIGPDLAGMMLWARRTGMRMCMRDARWTFITTTDFICTPSDLARGVVVSRWLVMPGDPRVPDEIARAGYSAFSPAAM